MICSFGRGVGCIEVQPTSLSISIFIHPFPSLSTLISFLLICPIFRGFSFGQSTFEPEQTLQVQ
ncbi:unnamed protein product, partial [Vitis vinifera]